MRNHLNKTILWIVCLLYSFCSLAQDLHSSFRDTMESRFIEQLLQYPQEKLYLHTDKSHYIAGEDIWFRVHKVDAFQHIPDMKSRYVYVELINPLDSLIERIRIIPREDAWYGHISLPENLSEGEYQLRTYTKYQEVVGEDYFFKRKIKIGGPLSSHYKTEVSYHYPTNEKEIIVEIRVSDRITGKLVLPELFEVQNNSGKFQKLKTEKDGLYAIKFSPSDYAKNILFIQYKIDNKNHSEYLIIPPLQNDFHVSFFPEGGQLVTDAANRVVFKALNSFGWGESISGYILNNKGDTITQFSSTHQGMGELILPARQNEKYYAVCINQHNKQKEFDLPESVASMPSLKVVSRSNQYYIGILKSYQWKPQPLYLLAHCRGEILYAEPWNINAPHLIIQKEQLPSGVVHFLLVNENFTPLSERLVFNINDKDQTILTITENIENYKIREAVTLEIDILDVKETPLVSSLSLSVTDDQDVQPDSSVNILSTFLLTSELKGYIESPAYYFQNRNNETETHLDILMMSQGWRRYNVEEIMKGNIEQSLLKPEKTFKISGSVKGGATLTRVAKNFPITIFSFEPFLYDETSTDEEGNFLVEGFEVPDSIQFVIQSKTKRGGRNSKILVEKLSFPLLIGMHPFTWQEKKMNMDNFLVKAEQKYTIENGIRTIHLEGVEIRATRLENKPTSIYSSGFNPVITHEEIEQVHPMSIFDLFYRQSGVEVIRGEFGEKMVSIRGGGPPLIMVDEVVRDNDFLNYLTVSEVESIEIIKDGSSAMFGMNGISGAILVKTKLGFTDKRNSPSFNIVNYDPFGYQVTKEFYSPHYDTPEASRAVVSDLRTTIYWNPDIRTDESGKAKVQFYSADTPTTYTILAEGVSSDGKLIHKETKISVK